MVKIDFIHKDEKLWSGQWNMGNMKFGKFPFRMLILILSVVVGTCNFLISSKLIILSGKLIINYEAFWLFGSFYDNACFLVVEAKALCRSVRSLATTTRTARLRRMTVLTVSCDNILIVKRWDLFVISMWVPFDDLTMDQSPSKQNRRNRINELKRLIYL